MFSYLVYSSDIVVYIRVWKTFLRLLYLDERYVNVSPLNRWINNNQYNPLLSLVKMTNYIIQKMHLNILK